ncbi:MAG: U32 family peptidase, partial [Methanobacteriaceae archaeon]
SLESLKAVNQANEDKIIYNRVYIEIPDSKDILNFANNVIKLSENQNYQLVWKLPNIIDSKTLKNIKRVITSLSYYNSNENESGNHNSDNLLSIMVGSVGIASYLLNSDIKYTIYGSSTLNIWNNESLLNLGKVKSVTISPELGKNDLESFINAYNKSSENNSEIDIIVHGKLELLESKHDLVEDLDDSKEIKDYFIENRDSETKFIVKKGFNLNTIIQSSEELCLIEEIPLLKKIGFSNFVVDGRWETNDYIIEVGNAYYNVINEFNNIANESELKRIKKILSNNGNRQLIKGNFKKGIYGY